MWETIAIIVTLGGLEFTLWLLDRRAARVDHEMQRNQLEVLDGILTELAIQNSEESGHPALLRTCEEEQDEDTRDRNAGSKAANHAAEHSVCH